MILGATLSAAPATRLQIKRWKMNGIRYTQNVSWSCDHLVGEAGRLTDDPQRQRLFVTQGLQVAADARPLDLPLTQVIREPDGEKRATAA